MLTLRLSTLLATLACLASAAPASTKRWDPRGSFWHDPAVMPSFIDFTRRQAPDSSSCNLKAAQMPTAPTPLPSPASDLSLFQVAIGRGTQNYTCDLSNTTAVPAAVGAVATLFNVSCVAADSPQLLDKLPQVALNLPVPADSAGPAYTDMTGHHYFLNPTTPFFNMDTSLHQYGTGAFKKVNSTNAPSGALPGQYGQGDGAVAWLKLDAQDSAGQVLQEVYRVNTAGGQPPATCAGMPASFEVQYAAEYWLFTKGS